ncbi:DnaD domain-containing protein [Bacillus sp. 03113]|uniref:DnaD domain-containing protein n=1 Tax=Bacillus sp. 03113 TaxID=2578211 RepID=UPI0015E8946A|nr:DnaD domain protein [Bacillus sp. 03113]
MTTKTKKVVIREELVELTGDFKLAIVLNQMIYWSERISDFDGFIKEEKERLESENLDSSNLEYQNGWIYKKADELADECMITNSEATMRRYLDKLVSCGWLDTRRNPKYKWDKTLQYRLNLRKIQQDLFNLGYFLEGYRFTLSVENFQNDESNFQNENTNFQNESTSFQNENSDFQNDDSNFHDERAIPEITSEITSEIKKEVEEEEAHVRKITPFDFFEQNGFGLIGSYMSEKISMWCEDLSDELVIKAMEIATEYGKTQWSYVDTILRNWASKNIKTVQQADALLMAFKKDRAKQRDRPAKGYKSKATRTEMLPEWFKENDTPSSNPVENQMSEEEWQKKQSELDDLLKKYREN